MIHILLIIVQIGGPMPLSFCFISAHSLNCFWRYVLQTSWVISSIIWLVENVNYDDSPLKQQAVENLLA